jgi:hypothetical protein
VHRTALIAVTTVLSAVAGLGLATPASATAPVPYCSASLDTGIVTCAATEEGLRAALQPALHVAASGTLLVAAASTTYVLGRLYDDANRTGAFFEVTASGPCDTSSDLDWELGALPAAWQDRTSSFQGYSGCQIRVYENNSFGGLSYGAYSSSNYVGDPMNDRTSSVRFY